MPDKPLKPATRMLTASAVTRGEQSAYHIHVLLAISIDGTQRQVPGQIGIPADGSCLYWLHTYDATGIVYNSPNAAPVASFDWSSGVAHPAG